MRAQSEFFSYLIVRWVSEDWDWAGEMFVKIHSTEKFSEYTFLYWENILEKNRAKKTDG